MSPNTDVSGEEIKTSRRGHATTSSEDETDTCKIGKCLRQYCVNCHILGDQTGRTQFEPGQPDPGL